MQIEVECCVCKKRFNRNHAEVNRNARLGRKIYCSRKCCGTDNVENIPKEMRLGDVSKLNAGNRGDEYSMFRAFMHKINLRKRDRKKESDLTLQDLKDQWEKQSGICPYTGWKLKAPKNSGVVRPRSPDMASLDRIDSSKGYFRGNIEFVSFMAQCAKNNFSKQDVIDFCSSVFYNKDTLIIEEKTHANRH